MKKISYILFLTLFWTFFLSAGTVSEQEIRQAGERFVRQQADFTAGGSYSINRIERLTLPTLNGVYVVHLQPTGFILFSERQDLPAVLAYSAHNRFTGLAPTRTLLNRTLQAWQQVLASRPQWKQRNQEQWHTLLSAGEGQLFKIQGDSIYYFPTPVWGQGYANGALVFNYYTPNHWSAGCVATAMAEVLAYYRWPIHGTSSHCYTENNAGQLCADFANTYYDWPNILDKYEGEHTTTTQRKAVGLLTYHAAVSVNMDFSSSGSEASVSSAPGAFHNYFRLSGHYKTVSASGFWTEVINNMKDARPVILAVHRSDGMGHAIVADGYAENNGFFHLNMGWNGDDNGWYDIRGSWNAGGYNAVDAAAKGLVPNPMINTAIDQLSETEFILSWSVSPRLKAQYFELQQASGSSGPWSTLNSAISDTFYQVQVDQIGNYYYRVRARRDDIWWDWSAVQKIVLGGPRYLTFNVNMNYQTLTTEDSVVLRGNIPPLKGSENSAALRDDNGDNIYSITLPFDLDYAGQELLYRFAIAGPSGTTMESTNRSYVIGWAEHQVLDTVYFDNYVNLEPVAQIPQQALLLGNTPNPFGPAAGNSQAVQTRIHYRLTRTAPVRLIVYNTLGQGMTVLVNQRQVAGTYQVVFRPGDNWPAGIYFYRLQSGTFSATGKMIFLR